MITERIIIVGIIAVTIICLSLIGSVCDVIKKKEIVRMSSQTKTTYHCDYCQKKLPEDYATTDGNGKGYYVKKAHDTIPLELPMAGCTGIVVEVTLGTQKDDKHFTDLCDVCRLKFLKKAVDYLEAKVGREAEGAEDEGEETDI